LTQAACSGFDAASYWTEYEFDAANPPGDADHEFIDAGEIQRTGANLSVITANVGIMARNMDSTMGRALPWPWLYGLPLRVRAG
jgi:hypothetical protein